ncbi:type II toxin-antitoxin system RelE/ParE family toxin [Mitsuaria sp. GD03876]|uniref:type II toxin-antitoxin system RelE/ParE family toxin n=1 Tax=Mitsuaria sp. GD03876 TaxID=2975399 RepID=UPI0024495DDC|nr:type II toxin-antitoxin system RelE/ParE family toxin [Mitsuaria sp. GD03876]MDH0866395.1 type II toxin-antitoxin system RelE/ParE family toxin [Mitsuaria sp. GD03876]
MIDSFADKRTAAIFDGREVRGMARDLQQLCRQKMRAIDAAPSIDTLRFPPGNRLELLKGDRRGQWSLRVNRQWRICFRWKDGIATDVEVADYH